MVGFGIIGCADIAQKIVRTLAQVEGCEVVAVASRNIAKAEEFCASLDLPASSCARYGNYADLLADARVQVVYLPLPTAFHKEWAPKVAAAGKHLLVEKPVGVTTSEVEEMVAACAANKVQFMDGVMWMHHVRAPKMREVVQSGELGKVTRVTSSFHFCGGDEFDEGNIRVKKECDPLGCVGDLGWYQIRAVLYLLQDLPSRASAYAHKRSRDGVITSCSATLFFASGVFATFDCGFDTNLRMEVAVSGSKATLSCSDFVLNKSVGESSYSVGTLEFQEGYGPEGHGLRSTAEERRGGGCCQEARMLERMRDIAASGRLEGEWPRLTLETQRVVDAVMQSADGGEGGGGVVAISREPFAVLAK